MENYSSLQYTIYFTCVRRHLGSCDGDVLLRADQTNSTSVLIILAQDSPPESSKSLSPVSRTALLSWGEGMTRRLVLFPYNPFKAVPLPALALAVTVGVISGVYIFDAPLREAAAVVIKEQQQQEKDRKKQEESDDKGEKARNVGQR